MRKALFALMLTLLFLPSVAGEREEYLVLLKVRLLEAKSGKHVKMTASWYGPRFHGRRRADGKRYNMHDPGVVAHKTLPFGTKLRLETENGSKLDVVVRDRGPYWSGRHLDLSYGAAEKLGIVEEGVATLRVTIISLPKGPK